MLINKRILKNQSGFSSVVLVVIIVILTVVSVGVRIYLNKQEPIKTVKNETQNRVEEPVDPTAGWKSYKSKIGKYSLKHPSGWYEDICDNNATDLALFLGTTKKSRVICNTEHGSQVIVFSTSSTPTASEQQLGENYKSQTSKKIVVDGVSGNRQTGKLKKAEFGLPAGTLHVRYFFLTPARSYIANYVQSPNGDYTADNLDNFDLMVQKTLKFIK